MEGNQQLKKCKRCQSEIDKKAKVCPVCKRTLKGHGCLWSILFFLLVAVAGIASISKEAREPKEPVSVVFDALQYEVKEGQNITEDELVEQLGEPDNVEGWDYVTGSGRRYPIRTLYYNDEEYSFNNDGLQRVTLWKEINYSNKNEFLKMFNLSKYKNTEINDTGSYYRAYYCGVHDIWIGYEDGKITMVKISYGDLFEQP